MANVTNNFSCSRKREQFYLFLGLLQNTMKIKVFTISLLLIQCIYSYSQRGGVTVRQDDVLESLKEKEAKGQITVYLDSLLEENYKKHLVKNSQSMGISGYRIRIFSDNGRGAKDNQRRVRARFISLFPDVDAYSLYEGSYFKIYVGDFRTKSEALLLLERIKNNFPDAFIVEDNNIVIKE